MQHGERVTEMIYIDNRNIAKLLKFLHETTVKTSHRINKMMDNISWKVGKDPNMILSENELPCDAVANSILELPLIDAEFSYYIVELIDKGSSQFIGACICENDDFVARGISCYTFIDWVNLQDTIFTGRAIKEIMLAGSDSYTVYIKLFLM